VRIDEDGRVIDIGGALGAQRAGREYIFAGIHLLEPEVFRWIPSGCFFEINRMVYPRLLEEGREVRGFLTDAPWAEVGSHRTYLQAQRDHLMRNPERKVTESVVSDRVELVPPVLVGEGCQIGDGTRIGPRVVVGDNCQIGADVVIEDSAVWSDVTIGSRVHMRGAIVGHRTRIDVGTELKDVVACGEERRRIA
jgi:mannose-1-phosphate guanylyltransferase